jgi:hypothetical protein
MREISVIVVPGVGTPPANTWFQGKGQRWPQLLPEDVLPSPSVYLFNHNLLLDTNPRLWSDVIEKGLELLEALMTLFNAKEEVCVWQAELFLYASTILLP